LIGTERRVHTGRPNVFQRLADTWDAVHPYNAGQACRIAGTFDAETVARAWSDSSPVQHFADDVPLDRHFTTDLNRPFADRQSPFRPFAQRLGGSTWLGLTYRHRVADSMSIQLLLREWTARVLGATGVHRTTCATKAHRRPSVGVSDALDLFRRYGDFRRCRKVHTMGPLDYSVRVRLLDTLHDVVPALLERARAMRVTLNDVFLAALAEACDRLIPTQSRPGRQDLALSTVVDLRVPRDSSFGCQLGFRSTVCRERDLRDWDRLLRAVAAQRGNPTGHLWMLAADVATRFSSPARLYDFYRKEAPFAGGISNVNLRGSWFDRHHPARVLDYIRVSPTGPLVPLAMNVTTLGDDLRLSMTYRTALLNDWAAAELAQMFVGRLTRMASSTSSQRRGR
jgi:hypothetical protein